MQEPHTFGIGLCHLRHRINRTAAFRHAIEENETGRARGSQCVGLNLRDSGAHSQIGRGEQKCCEGVWWRKTASDSIKVERDTFEPACAAQAPVKITG